MNAPIRRLAIIVSLLFASLLASTTYVMFVDAGSLNARADNRRTVLSSYSRERGQLLISGGSTSVAKSEASNDDLKWVRTYPQGELYSHVTGYYSFTYGAGGGLEGTEDALLSGSSDKLFYSRIADLFKGANPGGASLELTINPAAQKAADEALGNQRGAVVALDPRTGEVLAMVSHPTYDPNTLASHRFSTVSASWKELVADDTNPMLNRSIAQLYPPGSVFKIVTTAAALESGKYTTQTQIPDPASLALPQSTTKLPNWQGGRCAPADAITLATALETSCNVVFGKVGIDLGGDALRAQADKFGFGQTVRVPMSAAQSQVPAGMDGAQAAMSAIGQYDVRVTPLQVAMVSAAIANGGVVMQPHLVKSVVASDLSVLDTTPPTELGRAVSADNASTIATMMQGVVDNGTGSNAKISGVEVAGKTGTAQQGNGKPAHAWFTSFAPVKADGNQPQVAVAVVVEDGGAAGQEAGGNKTAAPIARAVMKAVLGK